MTDNCEISSQIWNFIKEAAAPLAGVLIGAWITIRHSKSTKKKEYALEKLDTFDGMIKDGLKDMSLLPRTDDGHPESAKDIKNANRSAIVKFKRQFSNSRFLIIRLMETNKLPPNAIKNFEKSIEMLKDVLTGDFKEENWWLPDERNLASWKTQYAKAIDDLRIELLK